MSPPAVMPPPAPPAPRRILILKPSSLGDIVHALPVLAGLRAAFPDAHIAWLVGRAFVSALEHHPHLDEVIVFDRRRLGAMAWNPGAMLDFLRLVQRLRRSRFDLVIDLQGLIRSGLLGRLSGAGRRIGFAAARELAWLFYTQRVATPDADEHAVRKNLRVLDALGVARPAEGATLAVAEEERASAARLLSGAGGEADAPWIAVLPGARWPSKRWIAGRHAELIDGLSAASPARFVLLGGPDERAHCEEIAARCTARVANLAGRTTLRELAAVLERCCLVICQDSGPMHLAAALGRPIVALFGPTNPARTGPYHPGAQVVRLPLACSPCYRRRCPLGHHGCMNDLEVRQVLAAARAALGQPEIAPAGGPASSENTTPAGRDG